MKIYPPVIKYSDYKVEETGTQPIISPSLQVAKSTTEATIRNRVSSKSCGAAEIWLNSTTTNVKSKKYHKTSDKPKHDDIPDTDDSRYCFAPMREDVWIHWKHKHPELIKESKLELFCHIGGKLTCIWTKTFIWDKCPPEAKTLFKGSLTLLDKVSDKEKNTGLNDVTLDYDRGTFDALFPGECLNVQFSTYQLKLTVIPQSEVVRKLPRAIWMYFDVLIHSIDLEWGNFSLLPKTRDDIDDTYKEKILGKAATDNTPKVVGFEETVLLDLKDTAKNGNAKPAAGKKHKVILTSNLFTTKKKTDAENFETGNQTDFNEYKKLWGYGPRIPILAKVSVKNSLKKPTLKAPEALMGARLLWDWDDDAPTRWEDPLTAGETPNFTKDCLNEAYHQHGAVKPTNSCNCPADFGGKLDDPDAKAFIFPEQNAPDAFPYQVKPCDTRKWAAFSSFQPKPQGLTKPETDLEKEARCKTGIIFQPSRMAGDKYKLTVCLDFTPTLDSEAALELPDKVKAEAGEFEVFRRINLNYLTYGTPAMNCNPDNCLSQTAALYLKEANLILEYARKPMDADFRTAYNNAKKRFLEDPENYKGEFCWHLIFDYFIDDNFAPGAPPLTFKPMDDALRDIEAAFKNGKIYEYTNVDARTLLKERVISRNRGVGIQITKDANAKKAIFVKQGDTGFSDNVEVVGEASRFTGKIAVETKPSFWGVTYSEETAPDKRYDDGIDVIINGTTVPIKYSRSVFKREVATELSTEAKTNLKQALANCDQSAVPTIKFKSKEDPSDNAKARLNLLKEFVKNSIIDRKAWLEQIKREKAVPGGEPDYKAVSLYDNFPLAFIPMLITEYIKLKHPKDEGIFLFHVPGRSNLKDLAIAPLGRPFKEPSLLGGSFPEISTRHQGIVYISSLPAGPKVASSPSKTMESIFAHELGHSLFLPHALKKTGEPPGGEREMKHVKGGTCLMNYDLDSKRFCGLCMIRLRGWKTEDDTYKLGADKYEYKIALELGDINELFSEDVTTDKGKQERMQVLGLLNYPLDHPDLAACYAYSWTKCQALFPALTGDDNAVRTLFEQEIKKMLVGTAGILPADGEFARIRVPTFTTMYSLNHLSARIPEADEKTPVAKPYERLILSSDRSETEQHFYAQNPALGKIPLVIKAKMRLKGSNLDWNTAPVANNTDVHIQLLPPDDFSAATGPATVNIAGATSYYNNFAAPDLEAKPLDYIATNIPGAGDGLYEANNAPQQLGGKRGLTVFTHTKAEGFDGYQRGIIQLGTNAQGEAKIVFRPSIVGGDAYKIRVFVGSPSQDKYLEVQNRNKTDTLTGDDIFTTGTMVRWRTIRITNHYRVNNSTNVGNLPAYLKPRGIVTSPVHQNHFGTIPALDLRGQVTNEFAKAYCEILLEPAALNPAPLANEEGNIRLTMNQLLTTYPKYNDFAAVKGRQGVELSTLYDTMQEDLTDNTRRTFTVKTRAFPIKLGTLSIRPLISKVDPNTLLKTEERTGSDQAVLIDKDCTVFDHGTATGKQEITAKTIHYGTGDVRIVFKEQQHRNYQVWYQPERLLDPAALLQLPFPAQTPYLINLRLPDDYNLAPGIGIPPMVKDAQGNLPSGNNHFLMLDAPKLGLGKGLYLDSVARGIKLNNGFNPGLIFVEAQCFDNLTAVAEPLASQEGKAVGQVVFLFTGATAPANKYKSLIIHEMSHALYLQHAPGAIGTSGVVEDLHDPIDICVMSYADNDADHCGKCVAALRGINVRSIDKRKEKKA